MDNDRRKIELLNSLLFSLRGTPVLYYGDEIGMGDNFYLGDRDGVRTPMQWSPAPQRGFFQYQPATALLTGNSGFGVSLRNGKCLKPSGKNTSSLLWFTKRMINMRKRYKAFGRGSLTFLFVETQKCWRLPVNMRMKRC